MIGRQRWAHLVFLIVTTGGRDTETAENDRRYSEDTTTFPQRSPWCAYYGQHWLQPLVRNGTATPLGPRPEEKKRKVRDDVPPAKAGSLPCSKYCCAQLVSLLFFVFFSLSSSYSPFRLYFSPLSKKSSYFNRLKNGHRRWPTESRTFSSQMLFKNRFNRIKSLCKCRLVWTDCSRLFCYRNSWLIISRTGSFWWSDLIT